MASIVGSRGSATYTLNEARFVVHVFIIVTTNCTDANVLEMHCPRSALNC